MPHCPPHSCVVPGCPELIRRGDRGTDNTRALLAEANSLRLAPRVRRRLAAHPLRPPPPPPPLRRLPAGVPDGRGHGRGPPSSPPRGYSERRRPPGHAQRRCGAGRHRGRGEGRAHRPRRRPGGHGHLFRVGGKLFGDLGSDIEHGADGTVGDEDVLTFAAATLSGTQAVEYEYDPGDAWLHTIRVEKVVSGREAGGIVPACTAGARACPPEDVGGSSGYEGFLWTLAHPNHKEHDNNLTWAGGAFDPDR